MEKMLTELLFDDGSKKMRFSVDGYEKPKRKKGKGKQFDYDANILTARIVYTENGVDTTYTNPCLLTTDLVELAEEFMTVIDGHESGFISDWYLPFFRVAVVKLADNYAVQAKYVCDTSNGWRRVYVSQEMSREEMINVHNILVDMNKQFPVR